MLSAYSLNYHLNGGALSQQLQIRTDDLPSWLRFSGLNASEHYFLLSVVSGILVAIMIWMFDRSIRGRRLWISRRTIESDVPHALGINAPSRLYISMVVYNLVAFVGGLGFALQNAYSGVSFVGAIAPGIACMFILRAAKNYAASPSRRFIRGNQKPFMRKLIRAADSSWFLVLILAILAVFISLMRFTVAGMTSHGMLNAYTAIGTVGVWCCVALVAFLMGKQVTGVAHGTT